MTTEKYGAVMALQRAHCSVRKYRDEPIEEALLTSLLESAQCAASTSFNQGYSIVRVTDPAAREKIAAAAGGQQWVVDAPEFFVICADLLRSDHACRMNDLGEIEGYTEHFISAMSDTAIFAQNLALAAESVGLGGVFIGGIRNDPRLIADTLGLPRLVFPAFGFCLGWPAEPCETKPRLPLEAILHVDRYDASAIDEQLRRYDETIADYYRSRSENRKQSTWTEQVAGALQKKTRGHMLEFMRGRGFLLK